MSEKELSGAIETCGGGKKCMQCLVGKNERRKPCESSKSGEENNIAMDLN